MLTHYIQLSINILVGLAGFVLLKLYDETIGTVSWYDLTLSLAGFSMIVAALWVIFSPCHRHKCRNNKLHTRP